MEREMDIPPADETDGGSAVAPPAKVELEDKDECRICRFPGEPGNPLRYPCACRGSIKYVHQECLLLWLSRRRSKKCEVCRRRYSFAPVYQENTPKRLPLHEVMIGLGARLTPSVQLFLAWFVVIPLTTYWIVNLPWGGEAAGEFQTDFMAIISLPRIVSACLLGMCYCFWIAYFMVIVTPVRSAVLFLAGEIVVENGQRQGMAGAARAQWRYMSILCNWWHNFFFHIVSTVSPEAPLAAVVLNAPLHEFGAIRRVLFLLGDNAFAVFATNISVSFLFVLAPFSIGRMILAVLHLLLPNKDMVTKPAASILALLVNIYAPNDLTGEITSEISHKPLPGGPLSKEGIRASFLSNETPIAIIVGYIIIWSLVLSYLVTTRRTLFPAIARQLSRGFRFVTVKFQCLFWISLTAVRKNAKHFAYGVKVASVLTIKLILLPCMCALWLDFCTFPMFGVTISERLVFGLEYPILILLYWVIGINYMQLARCWIEHVQKIVRKRALWFLQDVTDPSYKISELHFHQIILVVAFHGMLILTVSHLPIRAITFIFPSLFPLNIWGFTPNHEMRFFGELKTCIIVALLVLKVLKDPVHAARIESIVRKWFIFASYHLEISDFLLPRDHIPVPRRPLGEVVIGVDQNVRPLLPQRSALDELFFMVSELAEGSLVSSFEPQDAQTSEDDTSEQMDSRFLLRITLFLVLAALTMILVSSMFMALPILVGRVFFSSISEVMLAIGLEELNNDFSGLLVGYFIVEATACFAFEHVRTGRTVLLLNRVFLFSIWISIIPGLLGILIDLMVIIPLRVPLDESPVLFLHRDWLLGLVFLHIWTALVMLTKSEGFASRAWIEKVQRIKTSGINGLPTTWLLRVVLGSIIDTLLTSLCVPFVLVKFMLPMFGFSAGVNSAVRRFIWPSFLALILAWFGLKLIRDVAAHLHRLVLDDRYAVGQKLCDFTEDLELGIARDNLGNNNVVVV